MSILSYFSPQTLFKTHSLINGYIEVSEFQGKRELIVGGLQQSGELVAQLWECGIGSIKNYKLTIKNILLLGVGGGSSIPVIQKKFPNANIAAVEIDPVIVAVGKKYFGLGKYTNVSIIVDDAYDFVQKTHSYDLILIDTYAGSTIPAKIKSKRFLRNIQRLAAKGIVVLNHIRSTPEEEYETDKFEKQLHTLFTKVSYTDVLVNRLFICSQI